MPLIVSRIAELAAPARLGGSFRRLMVSTWVTNLGDGMALAAGPLLVASQTRNPLLVAAAAFVQSLPLLLFGFQAGVIADRINRKLICIGADLSRVALLAVLVGFITTGHVNIWVVLVVLFGLGTFETFADTAGPALLPMLVSSKDLGLANSRLLTGYVTFNQLAGPPIGAFLFAAGLAWSFVAQAVLLVFGAGVLMRLVVPSQSRPEVALTMRSEIRAGVTWLMNHPPVRTLALTIVTFNVAFGAPAAVMVLYAQDRLGLDSVGFGLLTSMSAIGGVIGTVAYPWLEQRVTLGTIMRVGLIWETLSHAALALTTTDWVAMAVFFVFGIHAFIWATTSTSIRQRAVPLELQGRVGSTYRMGMYAGFLIGQVLGGVIASQWGILAPFWFAFVASAVVLVLIWRQLPKIAHIND